MLPHLTRLVNFDFPALSPNESLFRPKSFRAFRRFFPRIFVVRFCRARVLYVEMEMTPDHELLRHFARTNSGDAFAELVNRHVNLVYSAALRQVNGDHHLARDIAQTVFTDLARKAAALAAGENLAGWLYTSAHFAAAKAVRGESRRRDREEKFMREPANEIAPDADWEKIRPALDDAMHELKPADRDAILLRYFENRQFAEVGARLGLNENAARMRVERALEKLRTGFAKRGITTVAALAAIISAHAVQTAPASLAAALTTTSVAAAGTGTATFFKIMTAAKIKLALSAVLVASAATALVTQHQNLEKLHQQNAVLQQQLTQLQTEKADLSNQLASAGNLSKLTDDQFNELLKLRGEVGRLRRQAGELSQLQSENQQLQTQVSAGQNQTNQISPHDQFKLHEWHTVNALKEVALAMRIYAGDHGSQYATNFDQLKNELSGVTNFDGNIPLNAFEFMNSGLVDDTMPEMAIFRERVARRMSADDAWEREYGLADGSVQTIYSLNGDFTDYEKQHSPPPPPAQ